MASAHFLNQPGLSLSCFLMAANRTSSSSLRRLVEERGVAVLGAQAEMDQQRGVAAVVEDHVRQRRRRPIRRSGLVVPVVLQRLALDGEDRRAAATHRRGGVVLRRIDVARGPADVGAERLQRLDQHRGLDRHVQRAGDARALERLRAGRIRRGSPSGPAFRSRRCRVSLRPQSARLMSLMAQSLVAVMAFLRHSDDGVWQAQGA